uniref:Uncharacterized protein n=1 Tax=Chromera velia CCMP2878 TaxID=1169474 RepID=A0A0G4HD27_9ALVE|eukprot:Cvel_26164.t1-p1 / transcript=Cvel_26164.t1 / gene=Cvel_26164 / organism=Chromera_velia_CCMP2878 / gene_product=hypothetical protein / transcript_product=hypothetical protein / location=Cvel_scaffold3073:3209-9233(-) / protein_length=584 / sequence_SO=supercontig / SO=protein_coding / is_pseudo=false
MVTEQAKALANFEMMNEAFEVLKRKFKEFQVAFESTMKESTQAIGKVDQRVRQDVFDRARKLQEAFEALQGPLADEISNLKMYDKARRTQLKSSQAEIYKIMQEHTDLQDAHSRQMQSLATLLRASGRRGSLPASRAHSVLSNHDPRPLPSIGALSPSSAAHGRLSLPSAHTALNRRFSLSAREIGKEAPLGHSVPASPTSPKLTSTHGSSNSNKSSKDKEREAESPSISEQRQRLMELQQKLASSIPQTATVLLDDERQKREEELLAQQQILLRQIEDLQRQIAEGKSRRAEEKHHGSPPARSWQGGHFSERSCRRGVCTNFQSHSGRNLVPLRLPRGTLGLSEAAAGGGGGLSRSLRTEAVDDMHGDEEKSLYRSQVEAQRRGSQTDRTADRRVFLLENESVQPGFREAGDDREAVPLNPGTEKVGLPRFRHIASASGSGHPQQGGAEEGAGRGGKFHQKPLADAGYHPTGSEFSEGHMKGPMHWPNRPAAGEDGPLRSLIDMGASGRNQPVVIDSQEYVSQQSEKVPEGFFESFGKSAHFALNETVSDKREREAKSAVLKKTGKGNSGGAADHDRSSKPYN